jgi:hypothetical protein
MFSNDLKMLKKVCGSLCLLLLWPTTDAQAQINVRDSLVNGWLITAQSGVHATSGAIGQRFGNSMVIGAGLQYKLKSNWIIGADGFYRFGNTVRGRENIFRDIQTARNEVLAATGDVAVVNLFQSGWNAQFNVARIFNKLGHNANSGFTIMMGAGYGQSWIRIDNPSNDAPQISGDYKKGYDELHAGVHLHQILGYTYLGNFQTVNFFVGLEFMQGYTEHMRGYSFSTRTFIKGIRSDYYYGLRLMWFIPIYDKNAQTFFYY